MKKILLVDDEVQILKALCRVFMDTEYEIITAESGKEALELLGENSVDLILSDMRMPYMDGYELLSQVKRLYPNVIRIILSGYTDEKIVMKALQNSVAKLYILKPWENAKLIKIIDLIFQTEEILSSVHLLTFINKTEHLPTIENSYYKILDLIDKDVDVAKISSEIEKNQSITSKILHVANSAYYNVKTGSLKQAISYIGIQNTSNLVRSTALMEGFISKERFRDEIELIWKHAYTTNKLMSFIYQNHLNKRLPDSLSTTGLLHNIGIVLLLSNYGEEYRALIFDTIAQKKSILEAERAKYGVTHNEVGSYLLKWWEFPYAIVEATMYHYNPIDKNITNSELICVLHIAQYYAWDLLKVETINYLEIQAFNMLNITKDDFEKSLSTFSL